MAEAENLSIDKEEAEWLRREAAKRGVSTADYLRQLREKSGGRASGMREWSAPSYGGTQRPSLVDQAREIIDIKTQAGLASMLNPGAGNGGGLTAEQVRLIIREENGGKQQSGTLGGMSDILKPLIEAEATLSILDRLKDRGGGGGKQIDAITKMVEEREKALLAEIGGLKTEIKDDKETKRQEAEAEKWAKLVGNLDSRIEGLSDQITEIRSQGTGSGNTISQVKRIIDEVNEARTLLNTLEGNKPKEAPPKEAGDLEKAKYVLDMVADTGSKLLEGWSNVAAANKGVRPGHMIEAPVAPAPPPAEHHHTAPPPPPKEAEETTENIPIGPYTNPGAVAPAPTPAPAAAPSSGAFDESQLTPEVREMINAAPELVDVDTGEKMTKEAFLAKYGQVIKEHPEALIPNE